MTGTASKEIRALDEAACEFDRLMSRVLAEADLLAVERTELERLHRVATTARLASTSFVLEAGAALIRAANAPARRTALQ